MLKTYVLPEGSLVLNGDEGVIKSSQAFVSVRVDGPEVGSAGKQDFYFVSWSSQMTEFSESME